MRLEDIADVAGPMVGQAESIPVDTIVFQQDDSIHPAIRGGVLKDCFMIGNILPFRICLNPKLF
jgi:hypothetical protein